MTRAEIVIRLNDATLELSTDQLLTITLFAERMKAWQVAANARAEC